VKSGTIFDDIIITDSLEEAQAFAAETFFAEQDKEKEMFEEIEESRKQKEKEDRDAKKDKESKKSKSKKPRDEEEDEEDIFFERDEL